MRTSKQIIDSLTAVRDRAQDTDFKMLWEQKRIQYIKSITPNVPAGGDLLNGWPEDGEPDYDTV
tara:strand:- start:14378 stop:14569 length:192 start_codon:yes stop_codon:yes gene_type:complete